MTSAWCLRESTQAEGLFVPHGFHPATVTQLCCVSPPPPPPPPAGFHSWLVFRVSSGKGPFLRELDNAGKTFSTNSWQSIYLFASCFFATSFLQFRVHLFVQPVCEPFLANSLQLIESINICCFFQVHPQFTKNIYKPLCTLTLGDFLENVCKISKKGSN